MSDIRNVSFDLNSRQDAVEVLQVVLDHLKGLFILTHYLVSKTLRNTITYNTCLCSEANEEKRNILLLPMSNKITFFDKLYDSETLSSWDKWFSPS